MELKNNLKGGEKQKGEKVNQEGQTNEQVLGIFLLLVGLLINQGNPPLALGLFLLGIYLILRGN